MLIFKILAAFSTSLLIILPINKYIYIKYKNNLLIKVKLINTDYNIYSDVIENFIKNFTKSGVVIKDSRNVIKSFESDKIRYNIKSFKIPNIFNAIVYNKLRSSKAERSYSYAQKLLSIGINTPEPIAYFEFKTKLFLYDLNLLLQTRNKSAFNFGKYEL